MDKWVVESIVLNTKFINRINKRNSMNKYSTKMRVIALILAGLLILSISVPLLTCNG